MENQTIKQTVESNEALSPQAETTKKQWVKPEMTVMNVSLGGANGRDSASREAS